MSTECRPLLGRHIDRDSTGCRSSIGRVSADISTEVCVDRYGFSLVDTRPIPHRYFTDSLPIPYRYSVDTRSILGRPSVCRVSVDMSVVNCPTLHWCCIDILLLSVDIKKVLSSFIVGGTCGLLEQIIIIMIIIITLLAIIRLSDYSRQVPRRRVAGKSFQVKDKTSITLKSLLCI